MLANTLIGLALLGVVIPLVLGVVAMQGKGEEARERSNKMMRWRVIMQAVAICVLFIGFTLKATS